MPRRFVLMAAVSAVAVAGLLPILVMVGQTTTSELHTGFAYYRGLFSSGRVWTLAGHSIALSSLTTLLTLLVGVPVGILLGKCDVSLRRVLLLVFAIPLVLPPYVLAVSWFNILGRGGVVSRWFGTEIASQSTAWLFGLGGCVLVLATALLPVVVLLTVVQLSSVRSHFEEAALLASGWPGVLRHITLPLIAPGISLAAVLVFLLSLGEFAVPIFLRFDVFPVESFSQFSAFYNFEAATAAALPLGVVTFVLLFFENFFLRNRDYTLRQGPGVQALRIPLRSWEPLFLLLVCALALLFVGLPIGVLFARAAVAGAFSEALTRAGASLFRSVGYAAVGATGLVLIGFLCGYMIQRRALRVWKHLDFLTVFLFALPGPVIAVGLISLWNRRSTNFVYATPIIILVGYLAQYSALTIRMCASALGQIPSSMEEAAQVSGAHWTRRLLGIVVPLVRDGLVAAWLVGYLFCLRDTGMTMLLYPPGRDTLPVRTFTLMANGRPELIAALCVLIVATALLPLVAMAVRFRSTARTA